MSTQYEFDVMESGCLLVNTRERYDFTYTVYGDTLMLDFALEYVTDCEYGLKHTDDSLTLICGSGTATP